MDLTTSHLFGYGFFLLKTTSYLWYRPFATNAPSLSSILVVPVFNEKLDDFVQCLESISRQTLQPSHVLIADDASQSTDCYDFAQEFASGKAGWTALRLESNGGKRNIHRIALQNWPYDILINLDSDTVMSLDALEKAFQPFTSSEVQGVCGAMSAFNKTENGLTRYLDYVLLSQDYDRAALSTIDSIIAPGRLSLMRRSVFEAHPTEYFNEQFLGRRRRNNFTPGDSTRPSRVSGHVPFTNPSRFYFA